MNEPLLPDWLWVQIEPLFPRYARPAGQAGRKPLSPRHIVEGILHILRTGIAWEEGEARFEGGVGRICRNRLKTWQRQGVWEPIQAILQQHLPADEFDWQRTAPGRPKARKSGRRAWSDDEDVSRPAEFSSFRTPYQGLLRPFDVGLANPGRATVVRTIELSNVHPDHETSSQERHLSMELEW